VIIGICISSHFVLCTCSFKSLVGDRIIYVSLPGSLSHYSLLPVQFQDSAILRKIPVIFGIQNPINQGDTQMHISL
jgi:hypothetical protein